MVMQEGAAAPAPLHPKTPKPRTPAPQHPHPAPQHLSLHPKAAKPQHPVSASSPCTLALPAENGCG